MNSKCDELYDITIKELIITTLRKWRLLFVLILTCTIVISLVQVVPFINKNNKNLESNNSEKNKNVIEVNQTRQDLVKLSKYYNSLLTESIYYNLNSDSFYKGSLEYCTNLKYDEKNPYIVNNILYSYKSILESEDFTNKIIQKLGDGYTPTMLNKVMQINLPDDMSTSIISISIFSPNQDFANKLIKIIENEMPSITEKVSSKIQNHKLIEITKIVSVTSDKVIETDKVAIKDAKQKVETSLNSESNTIDNNGNFVYTNKQLLKHSIKVIVLSGFGSLLAILCIALLYNIFAAKIKIYKQLIFNYGLKIIGEFKENTQYNFIDRFLLNQISYTNFSKDEDKYNFFAESIAKMSNNKTVFICCRDICKFDVFVNQLEKQDAIKDIKLSYSNNSITSKETINLLSDNDNVILVIKNNKTKCAELDEVVNILNNYQKPIIGAILVD